MFDIDRTAHKQTAIKVNFPSRSELFVNSNNFLQVDIANIKLYSSVAIYTTNYDKFGKITCAELNAINLKAKVRA